MSPACNFVDGVRWVWRTELARVLRIEQDAEAAARARGQRKEHHVAEGLHGLVRERHGVEMACAALSTKF